LRILLVNDDGIAASGIKTLCEVLSEVKEYEVLVAAPAAEQSGMAQAITVHRPIRVENYDLRLPNHEIQAWKIHGTPADCVKLSLEVLLTEAPPDLVISGINRGSNLGTDVLYSGTVGAAIEAFLHGIPSIAVSLDVHSKFSFLWAAEQVKAKIGQWCEEAEEPFLYNVNFPKFINMEKDPFVFTKLGRRDYENAFHRIVDEENHVLYQMAGEIADKENDEATDIFAANQGYISITPLQIDLTDYLAIEGKLSAKD
jgi:5'-nucleotidase